MVKQDFELKGIKYQKKDNVVIKKLSYYDFSDNQKLNELVNLDYLNQISRYDDKNEALSKLAKLHILYPNFEDCFIEQVKEFISDKIELEKKNIQIIKEDYTKTMKDTLINLQKDFDKLSHRLEVLNDKTKAFDVDEKILGD